MGLLLLLGGDSLPNTMTFEVSGGDVYARFPWNATYDAVQRFAVTSTTASATANGCVQPTGIRRIPIATGKTAIKTAFDAATGAADIFASQTDDAPPCRYNNTYIGGNHGVFSGKVITATGHGKTVADIGSQWLSGAGVTFYIIRIVDANTLWLLSNNIGANAELWVFNTGLAAPGTLTHVAGATNTADISFTAAANQQVFPCVQNHQRLIYKNGNSLVSGNGVYDCNFLQIRETYGIANPVSMLDFLIAGRPWSETPALNDNSIDTQVELSYTYTIRDNGSVSIEGRFENLQTVNLGTGTGFVGFVQAQPSGWQSGSNVETLNLYVPRVNSIVGTVKTWDFEAGEAITPAAFETISFTSATWSDANNPPDRMVQYVTTTATGVKTRGYALGYSRLAGAGADLADYVVGLSGFISSSRKMYPHCLTAGAPAFGSFASTLPVNSVLTATAYRIMYNLEDTPEATTAAVRLTANGAEVVLDFHEDVTEYEVPVPSKLNGKTVTVVDGNGNLTLDNATVADGKIVVTVTGGYGEAVLSVS
jgi:hypothetical protein